MSFLPVLKAASDLIVSMGAGAVVTNAIKATTPAELKTFQKVSVTVGAMVLSSMAGDAATKYTHAKFDEVEKQVREVQKNVNEAKK